MRHDAATKKALDSLKPFLSDKRKVLSIVDRMETITGRRVWEAAMSDGTREIIVELREAQKA